MQITSILYFSEVNGLDKNRCIPFGVGNGLVRKQKKDAHKQTKDIVIHKNNKL
jgi:hypothetical protein